ncbi:ring-cleaving dioxygenase [Metabacillus sp. RGM 3146]|uniref:ring-cleaving dioxygenase n=1 Tax=Metabacillus sp. RGM 3146 TaxID=3401092 RepID=UPI003B9AFCD9
MAIKGLHHVSALTANAKKNYDFFTSILGMRLVKKTVNQDDTSVYHLFYGDKAASPGSELTFFEIPNAARTHKGAGSISAVSLRVKSLAALYFWEKRLEEFEIETEPIRILDGRKALPFMDPEGLKVFLIAEKETEPGNPWESPGIPLDYAILGLGPVQLTVNKSEPTVRVLEEVLGFRKKSSYKLDDQSELFVFEVADGGAGSEIHVIQNSELPRGRIGRGGVHHVALRVADKTELEEWHQKILSCGYANSGIVERYYFKALYFRDRNGILFELSTDGPGFSADEREEELGISLALPPFLEPKREEIEAKLKPLDF